MPESSIGGSSKLSRPLLIIACLLIATAFLTSFLFSTSTNPQTTKLFLVPHNPLFQSDIKKFLNNPSVKSASIITIIGPNHEDIGELIESDNSQITKREYSVQLVKNIVNTINPNAETKLYILRPEKSLQLTSSALKIIKNNPQSIVILSVDFAHYLDKKTSLLNDKATINTIRSKNITQLINYGPDHLDCGNCFLAATQLGVDLSSLKVTKNFYYQATSYVFATAN